MTSIHSVGRSSPENRRTTHDFIYARNMLMNSLSCLLCSSEHLQNSAQLSGREIRSLWRELGKEFPSEALPGIGEDSNLILWRCADCGFEFFDPALAGNGLFYQCLE